MDLLRNGDTFLAFTVIIRKEDHGADQLLQNFVDRVKAKLYTARRTRDS